MSNCISKGEKLFSRLIKAGKIWTWMYLYMSHSYVLVARIVGFTRILFLC